MPIHAECVLRGGVVLPTERQKDIVEHLRRHGRVLATDLARVFGTSEDTIRRDLRDLAGQGLCQRVYGGALAISPASHDAIRRAGDAPDRKRALGTALATFVQPGQFAFMDAGSTNLAAALALPAGLGVTVATHDPAIAAALVGRAGVELLLVGGPIDPHTGAALGAAALRSVATMRPDLLLLGTCALDGVGGLSAFHAEDAEMKRVLVESAGTIAAAVLNEKLGTAARFSVGPADVIADLVLEADAPEAVAAALARDGLRIHRAGRVRER